MFPQQCFSCHEISQLALFRSFDIVPSTSYCIMLSLRGFFNVVNLPSSLLSFLNLFADGGPLGLKIDIYVTSIEPIDQVNMVGKNKSYTNGSSSEKCALFLSCT